MAEAKKLEGLGGWLILVGLVVVMSPIRQIMVFVPLYSQIFFEGSWEELTRPGGSAYNPFWGPIIIGELVVNLTLFFTWIYTAYLFFSKNKRFPLLFRSLLIFTLCFILVDAAVIKLVLPNEPIFDPETIKEVGRTIVAVLIWVPYTLVSKRVKNTFTDKSAGIEDVFK